MISYSLEGLPAPGAGAQPCPSQQASERGECAGRAPPLEGEERGSLVSLTEEEADLGDASSLDSQVHTHTRKHTLKHTYTHTYTHTETHTLTHTILIVSPVCVCVCVCSRGQSEC